MPEIFNSVLKSARFYQSLHVSNLHSIDCFTTLMSDVFWNQLLKLKEICLHPRVLEKQVASMSKATAHSLKSFNRAKGILEVVTQKGKNV